MKRNIFTSFEEFEKFFDNFTENHEVSDYQTVTIIDSPTHVCADLDTVTNSLKVALNRFFKQLEDFPIFEGWKESITESIKCGCWEDKETYLNEETCKYEYHGGWSYTVEDNDGSFYICLNVSK